ncbi:protein lin-54 homolog isoform X2 [Pectinophora gossypiella]|uniref:protein lin-54 homolog isoform X2 n=1 Tax=Pectinophora gossypiella TaxID=13191 RepID=UPI00214F53BF|nr:protein lin-54 homolog isoform X2 [Pectinophora gossypiella]
MDHNLDDSLNLESAIGVDFDQAEDTVVTQADITLDAGSHEDSMQMEFEHIQEQPILMDTGNDEIIVSDFMGEQFTLQEYSDDQISGVTCKVERNEDLPSHTEESVDLQFEEPISVPASGVITQEVQMQPKFITVKSLLPPMRQIAPKKEAVVLTKTIPPRQVAIAPKPPKLVQTTKSGSLIASKQFAIAPKPIKSGAKPVTLLANRSAITMKNINIPSTQEGGKGNTVLAQLGKHLVMVPSSGHKIKLVAAPAPSGDAAASAGTNAMSSVRLINASNLEEIQMGNSQKPPATQGSKQVMTKVIVQAGSSKVDMVNQSAILSKFLPTVSAGSTPTRYVTVQQKFGGNKVLLSPGSKPGVRFTKKQQVIAIKSPPPKLVPVSSQQGTTKKVVITANPQNVILRTTAPSKPGHVTKAAGQRTQLHQINVPGKGIQYIKLVTNPTQHTQKQVVKTQSSGQASKTFVLTDSKGNVIQMTAKKMGTPPPLLVTSNVSAPNKLKAPQKLVRIAPVTSKAGQLAMPQSRGQSLLAPLSPPAEVRAADPAPHDADHVVEEIVHEETDSKSALQALIADAVGSEADAHDVTHGPEPQSHVKVDYDRHPSPECDDSMDCPESQSGDHPVIVIPSYMKQDVVSPDDDSYESSRRLDSTMINVEVDPYNAYHSPNAPQVLSDTDLVSTELGMRARKACNCTKSQCLKLYCDCFANGEFCNCCNCINCHNNLDNEELRQQAIRGCLDRNPNAFRPKIGKSKAGGPEIIRRHNKGCNCKRSGCLKNYCECYEAKIACTSICKCVGCRNVEDTLERARGRAAPPPPPHCRAPPPPGHKQPCSFMTTEVIEAVCQCLLAAAVEGGGPAPVPAERSPLRSVLEEFARCLQDIISASHQAAPLALLDETHA